MYLIINNTDKTYSLIEGNYPLSYVEDLLDKKNDVIVISLYSHTIKVCTGYITINGIREYQWKEYSLPIEIIHDYFKLYGLKKR